MDGYDLIENALIASVVIVVVLVVLQFFMGF